MTSKREGGWLVNKVLFEEAGLQKMLEDREGLHRSDCTRVLMRVFLFY